MRENRELQGRKKRGGIKYTKVSYVTLQCLWIFTISTIANCKKIYKIFFVNSIIYFAFLCVLHI